MTHQVIPQRNRFFQLCLLMVLLISGVSACSILPEKEGEEVLPTATLEPAPPEEKRTINHLDLGVSAVFGGISYQTDLKVGQEYPPAMVVMQDASHIVLHNRSMPAPASAQTLGYITVKGEYSEYSLMLPARPNGTYHDINHDGVEQQGVQVFYFALETLQGGGAYYDDEEDWSDYFSSITFEDPAATKISGGYLMVWADDEQQSFPSGFGDDGILFTDDDPVKSVKQGYTLVDMNIEPFRFDRNDEASIGLFQQPININRELEKMTYTEAFTTLIEDMETNYAFTDVEGKSPDWDELNNLFFPMIQEAEEKDSSVGFYNAIEEFSSHFSDSHVSVFQTDGNDYSGRKYFYGFGFMVDELEEGDFIVSYLDEYSTLHEHGIRLGDKLVSIGGKAVEDILAENAASYGPYSRESVRRTDQVRDLTRAKDGRYEQLSFEVPDGSIVSFYADSYYDYLSYFYGMESDSYYYWPVEYTVTNQGNGYILITTNANGEDFTRHMFENALDDLQRQGVDNLIIDLRNNYGGELFLFAEYFIEEPFKISDLLYPGIKDVEGNSLQHEVWARPYVRRYDFDNIYVLVGQDCHSACEVESYALSQVPNVKLVGEEATAGAVALIYGDGISLPDGIEFNFSIARFLDANGNIFLEGQGVSPDIEFSKSLGTISANYDWLMYYVEHLEDIKTVADIQPQFNPQPVYVSEDRILEMLSGENQVDLADAAVEYYPQNFVPGNTYTYQAFVDTNDDVYVHTEVCTYDLYLFENYFNAVRTRFVVNGEEISNDYVYPHLVINSDTICQRYLLSLTDWSEGLNQVEIETTFNGTTFDGWRWYPAGSYTELYDVYVNQAEE